MIGETFDRNSIPGDSLKERGASCWRKYGLGLSRLISGGFRDEEV